MPQTRPTRAPPPQDPATTQSVAAPAKETVGEKHASPAHEHGSSTPLALIEATLASQSLAPLLHQTGEEPAKQAAQFEAASSKPVDHSAGVTLRGSDGADVIIGTAGDDRLSGGAGADHIEGKAGNDTIHGGGGGDTASGGSGNDSVDGGSGNDKVSGDSGNDAVQGGAGQDVVQGGSGNDVVDGGTGDDIVAGGSGDDIVIGGLGADWLSGGDGSDCFQFNSLDDSGTTAETRDHIVDFKQGADKIDLVKINADFEALGHQALAFIGLADFNPGDGQLRYQHLHGDNADDDRTFVELNNGDGHAHMQIELHGLFTMTLDDFLL
jgi:Ca2+-binding RTX toxin-like protein